MLKELIERLEKASGLDRELDALIECETSPSSAEWPEIERGFSWSFEANEDGSVEVYIVGGKRPIKHRKYSAPRYTASLDAALSLMPEGWEWALFFEGGVYRCEAGDPVRCFAVEVPTAAIAVCHSALTARASNTTGTP